MSVFSPDIPSHCGFLKREWLFSCGVRWIPRPFEDTTGTGTIWDAVFVCLLVSLTVERQDTAEALQEIIFVDLAFSAAVPSHDAAHCLCVQHEPCIHIYNILEQTWSREGFSRSGLNNSGLEVWLKISREERSILARTLQTHSDLSADLVKGRFLQKRY